MSGPGGGAAYDRARSGAVHSATGRQLEGTVGPQGELTMRLIAPPNSGGGYRPVELVVSGLVDGAGMARARQLSNSCSYDFIWRK